MTGRDAGPAPQNARMTTVTDAPRPTVSVVALILALAGVIGVVAGAGRRARDRTGPAGCSRRAPLAAVRRRRRAAAAPCRSGRAGARARRGAPARRRRRWRGRPTPAPTRPATPGTASCRTRASPPTATCPRIRRSRTCAPTGSSRPAPPSATGAVHCPAGGGQGDDAGRRARRDLHDHQPPARPDDLPAGRRGGCSPLVRFAGPALGAPTARCRCSGCSRCSARRCCCSWPCGCPARPAPRGLVRAGAPSSRPRRSRTRTSTGSRRCSRSRRTVLAIRGTPMPRRDRPRPRDRDEGLPGARAAAAAEALPRPDPRGGRVATVVAVYVPHVLASGGPRCSATCRAT